MNILHNILPKDIMQYVITPYLHSKFKIELVAKCLSEEAKSVAYIKHPDHKTYIFAYGKHILHGMSMNTIYRSKLEQSTGFFTMTHMINSEYLCMMHLPNLLFEMYYDRSHSKNELRIIQYFPGTDHAIPLRRMRTLCDNDQQIQDIFFTQNKYYVISNVKESYYIYCQTYYDTNYNKGKKLKYKSKNLKLNISDSYIYIIDGKLVYMHDINTFKCINRVVILFENYIMYEDCIFAYNKNIVKIYSIFTLNEITNFIFPDIMTSLNIVKNVLYYRTGLMTYFYSIEKIEK